MLGAQCLPDGFEDERRLAQRGQAHPEHARLELTDEVRARLDREPRLARSAGAAQSDDSMLADKFRDSGGLPFPADE